jgi:predicted secreted protein
VEGDAQTIAIDRFKVKAAELAKGLGFSGYSLREVAVNTQDHGGPRPMRSMALASAPQAEMAVPVEAGKSTVTVTVSGSVQLR